MTPQRHGDTWLQAIPVDWPGFAGHFPGRPIVPAAELLAAACHCAADCGTATDQVRSARFLSPVAPGDHLNWHAKPSPRGLRLSAYRNDTCVCEVLFPG